jgi:hypothetical protein
MRSLAIITLLATTASAQPAATVPDEEPPPRPTPFDQGRFGLSGGAGFSTAFGQRYFGVGLGATYYVLNGVGVGASTQVQWGDGPTILRVSPELRYVAQPLVYHWPVVPYVAGYYTHWFIGSMYEDVDAVGGRTGLLYVSGSVVLGLGVGVEHVVNNCPRDDAGNAVCNSIYPDLTIAVAF